jgi:F0F1-type ATP synthase membrane subunit b/b'
VRHNLANIDAERARIVSDANESAERIRADGIVRNDTEVAELEARAEADVEASRGRAASDLQAQVATWAGEVTERATVAHLDAAAQQRLVEDFIAKVGASA